MKFTQKIVLNKLMKNLGTVMYRCYVKGYEMAQDNKSILREEEFKERFEKIFKEKLMK